MLRTKWSSPVTSLGPFDPHGTCKKWQKYKNKLRMRNTQLPKKHCCLWTSAMFSIFLGGWGRGATHWTTDMFIVSANIFRWSLSGQVWSYFSYYRPCLSCGGPCPGFCTCSKLLAGHYIIPQLLYCIVRRNYTSTASTCHTAHSVLWAMQCLGAGACIRCIVMIELELDGGACNPGKIFKEISFSPTRWEGWPRWILRASEEARRQRTKNHTMPIAQSHCPTKVEIKGTLYYSVVYFILLLSLQPWFFAFWADKSFARCWVALSQPEDSWARQSWGCSSWNWPVVSPPGGVWGTSIGNFLLPRDSQRLSSTFG